jgi:hypothetical protein
MTQTTATAESNPDTGILEFLRDIAHSTQVEREKYRKSRSRVGIGLAILSGVGSAIAGGGFAFADQIQSPWTLAFAFVGLLGAGVAAVSATLRAPEQAAMAQRDANLLKTYVRWVEINEKYSPPSLTSEDRRAQVLNFATWLDSIEGAEVPPEIIQRLQGSPTSPQS